MMLSVFVLQDVKWMPRIGANRCYFPSGVSMYREGILFKIVRRRGNCSKLFSIVNEGRPVVPLCGSRWWATARSVR